MGTSMYGFNPYMNTGLNADFMSTATANPYTNPYADPYSQLAALQQPTADTFQKSEGGSGLNSGLKLAAVGGVGAGAGAYFFGDKLGTTFTKDGKTFSDDILKAFQTETPEQIAKAKLPEVLTGKTQEILSRYHINNAEQLQAVQQYLTAENPSALSEEIKNLVPEQYKNNPNAHRNYLKLQSELGSTVIGQEQAYNSLLAEARTGNLAYQTEHLTNLGKRKTLLEGLAKDAKTDQIKDLIAKNPAAFGIEKTAEAEIQAEAKTIAERLGKDKTTAVNTITNDIKAVETNVGNLRKTLNDQVAVHWDDTAKAFRESAPSQLKNATKSFKWAKAGKFAAIAAGAGLVLGWMFGGNKS